MKRLISVAALAALMICSCHVEKQESPLKEGNKVTIRMYGSASGLTRTGMERNSADNGYQFFWEDGDTVNIFESNVGMGSIVAIDSKCTSYEKEFEMVFPLGYDPDLLNTFDLDFLAIYPHIDFHHYTPRGITISIPEIQEIPSPGMFDPKADLLVSRVQTRGVPDVLRFDFDRIGSIVRMTLANLPPKKEIFEAEMMFDQPVSGPVQFYQSSMTYNSIVLGSHYIYLIGKDGGPLGTTDENGTITLVFRAFPSEVREMKVMVSDKDRYYGRKVLVSEHPGAKPIKFTDGGMTEFSVDFSRNDGVGMVTDLDLLGKWDYNFTISMEEFGFPDKTYEAYTSVWFGEDGGFSFSGNGYVKCSSEEEVKQISNSVFKKGYVVTSSDDQVAFNWGLPDWDGQYQLDDGKVTVTPYSSGIIPETYRISIKGEFWDTRTLVMVAEDGTETRYKQVW